MGLGFHIGQGRIDNLGEYLGDLTMDEHYWLHKNHFIINDPKYQDPLSLPWFDDVILTQEQVLELKLTFDTRLEPMTGQKLNIHYESVMKFQSILEQLINFNQGLSTVAD